MPSYAWILIALGAVALAVALFLAFRRDKLEPGQAPDGWNGSDEAHEWDERAAAARADYGLESVRATASKWTASIAALLGILSTVAFVAGPSDLTDVGGWEAELAGWLVLLAAALAAISLCLAVMAEQGSPEWSDSLDGWTLKSLTRQRADRSARRFRRSRYLVLVALVLIVVATAIAWMKALTGGKSSTQSAIVVMAGGAVCGTLESHDGSLRITTAAGTQDVSGDARITLTSSCP